MKRALILIVVITVLTVGGCCWLDHKQQQTAMEYLEGLTAVRRLILQGDMAQALREQACLHALWQHDAHWLNALWDHHHTRDVEASMRHLATALEENSRLHALLAMDDVMDALEAVAQRDMAAWENIM